LEDDVLLIRDVLDKQLVDKQQNRIGKADGIVLSLSDGDAPRVAFIEIGSLTLSRRLGRRPQRWMLWIRRTAGTESAARPFRVPWAKVRDVGVDIELDVDRFETPLERWQEWLRRHVINWIPGGRS
jgi:sporulation protein YlmC with PRC-barrel domain